MSRNVKDGWHKVYGLDVYVEDGVAKRATTGDGVNYRPAGIYEKDGLSGWLNVGGVYTLDELRRRIKGGKIRII